MGAQALHAHLAHTRNLILYESTDSLVKMLASADVPEWTNDLVPTVETHTWTSHALDTLRLLDSALGAFSYEGTLLPRLTFARVLANACLCDGQQGVRGDDSAARQLLGEQFGDHSTLAATDVIPVLEELRAEIAEVKERSLSAIAETSRTLAAEITDLRSLLDERRRSDRTELRTAVNERSAADRSELRAFIDERSASDMAEIRAVVDERGASTVAQVKAIVEGRHAADTGELRAIVRDREAIIEALQNSASWSLTGPLRAACELWMKVFGRGDK